MAITLRTSRVVASCACSLLVAASAVAAEAPPADKALALRPVQSGVQIDVPPPAEIANCTVKAERHGKTSGWVVRDPHGTVLRRFLDTNADNYVDQWCYYRFGVEVYRDIDSNFNQKADQYRWFHTGGSRWGIDKNEDGKIDVWKFISPEEASEEAQE